MQSGRQPRRQSFERRVPCNVFSKYIVNKLTCNTILIIQISKCAEPRSKSLILETVQKQVELACEGNEAELKRTYTANGIKDKYTEYWINDILDQYKKEVDRGASKATVSAA